MKFFKQRTLKGIQQGWKEVFLALGLVTLSIGICIAFVQTQGPGRWFLLPLQSVAILQAVFQFHDCLHGAVFKRAGLNAVLGRFIGSFYLWPYEFLRRSHLMHHQNAGRYEDDPEVLHFTQEMMAKSKRARILGLISSSYFSPFVYTPVMQSIDFFKWLMSASRKELLNYTLEIFLMMAAWGLVALYLNSATLFIEALVIGYVFPGALAMALVYFVAKPLHTQMRSEPLENLSKKERIFWTSRSFETNVIIRLLFCNLNYHIEHHLYPGVSRWKLRNVSFSIREELKTFTQNNQLPYAFHRSYFGWYKIIHPQIETHNKITGLKDWNKANPAC